MPYHTIHEPLLLAGQGYPDVPLGYLKFCVTLVVRGVKTVLRSERMQMQQFFWDQGTGPCGPSGAQCRSRAVDGMQVQTIVLAPQPVF